MSLIKLDQVSKYYKSADTVSVGMRKVSLTFDIGELVAVTGESGSGKSTLLNVISGLDSYEEGEFYLFGEETSHYTIKDWESYRSKYVGFVFQNYNIIDSYTVLQNVLLALEIQNYPAKQRKKRALELIEQVGLTSHKHHKASKLSGGQKQRCVIARALAKDTPIIVADEPTGNLDSESSKNVIKLLSEIAHDRLVIVVTHDYDQIAPYATRRIKMHDGEVAEDKKIRPAEIKDIDNTAVSAGMNIFTVMKFALRNLFATPRRLFFFLLLQISIIFSFTLVFGLIMYTLRGINFGSGLPIEQEYFTSFSTKYIPNNRLIVMRKDGDILSNDDIAYLNNITGDDFTIPHITKLDERDVNSYQFINNDGLVYIPNELYTDSVKMITTYYSNFMIAGEIPTDAYHVVLSNKYMDMSVGNTIRMYAEYDFSFTEFTVQGIINDGGSGKIYFTEAYYDMNGVGRGMTIFAKNVQTAELIKNTIDKTEYRVIYPAQDRGLLGRVFDPVYYVLSIVFYAVAFSIGLFLFLILSVVFRNVMHARKKDFAVYRAIGASQSKLGWLIIFEQLFMMAISVIINYIIVAILVRYDFFFNTVFGEMSLTDSIILFISFIFFSFWLGLRFNHKIFNFTIIETLASSKEELA